MIDNEDDDDNDDDGDDDDDNGGDEDNFLKNIIINSVGKIKDCIYCLS